MTQFELTGDGRQSLATVVTMKPNSKNLGTSPIAWSLPWAFAIIAAAFLFKGNAARNWIETGLVIGALAFVVLQPQRLVCRR
jgi:hypothetical protein